LTAGLEVDGRPRRVKPSPFFRPALPIRRSQWHREVAAKLFCEIDRYTGVHTALSVQELGMVIERHDRPMPNAWMNIKTAAAVTPERNELLRCHVVPRQSERHDKTLAMQRIEQLTAIGMVIGAPDQRLLPPFRGAVGGRLFRPIAPGEEVAVAYGVVAGVKGLAFPPELEHSFGDASLIARVLVDRSPA